VETAPESPPWPVPALAEPQVTPGGPPVETRLDGGPLAGRDPATLYLDGLAPSGRRSQRAALERIARWASGGALGWREFPWHRVRYQHAARIQGWLRDAYPAPATANTYRAALRGVLRQCWLLGQLPAEEWQRIQTIGRVRGTRLPRGRNLEDEELARLFAHLVAEGTVVAARDAAAIAVMVSSGGVRLDELTGLTLDGYDPGDRAFRLVGKGNRERKVWLSEQAAEALADWLRRRGSAPGYVFLPVARDRTTILHGRRLAQSTLREMCARRARQVGIPHFSPHDLRRTSISRAIELSDLSTARDLAGHVHTDTTAGYDRRGEESRRAAARRLRVPYAGRPAG